MYVEWWEVEAHTQFVDFGRSYAEDPSCDEGIVAWFLVSLLKPRSCYQVHLTAGKLTSFLLDCGRHATRTVFYCHSGDIMFIPVSEPLIGADLAAVGLSSHQ